MHKPQAITERSFSPQGHKVTRRKTKRIKKQGLEYLLRAKPLSSLTVPVFFRESFFIDFLCDLRDSAVDFACPLFTLSVLHENAINGSSKSLRSLPPVDKSAG